MKLVIIGGEHVSVIPITEAFRHKTKGGELVSGVDIPHGLTVWVLVEGKHERQEFYYDKYLDGCLSKVHFLGLKKQRSAENRRKYPYHKSMRSPLRGTADMEVPERAYTDTSLVKSPGRSPHEREIDVGPRPSRSLFQKTESVGHRRSPKLDPGVSGLVVYG